MNCAQIQATPLRSTHTTNTLVVKQASRWALPSPHRHARAGAGVLAWDTFWGILEARFKLCAWTLTALQLVHLQHSHMGALGMLCPWVFLLVLRCCWFHCWLSELNNSSLRTRAPTVAATVMVAAVAGSWPRATQYPVTHMAPMPVDRKS